MFVCVRLQATLEQGDLQRSRVPNPRQGPQQRGELVRVPVSDEAGVQAPVEVLRRTPRLLPLDVVERELQCHWQVPHFRVQAPLLGSHGETGAGGEPEPTSAQGRAQTQQATPATQLGRQPAER